MTDGSAKPELLWETKPEKERYYGTPLYADGFIYAINQKYVYSVIDAKTGAVVATRKLDLGGTVYPSITLGGKYLYVSDDAGKTLVLEPGTEYKEVAANKLEAFRSCPLFVGKRVYIRTQKNLFCFGE